MKEQFVLIKELDFKKILKEQGRFIALANTEEVIWGPLEIGMTHEQLAQLIGKDPRSSKENLEWFENHVRLRYNLAQKLVTWTFAIKTNPESFLENRRKVRTHYKLGFDTLNNLASLYRELKDLKLELLDIEELYSRYACVSIFKRINGKYKLAEMSISEENKGLTFKKAQLKYK